ncbi:predicted protein [Nematostella vectensis]|uniref:Uncharacterized protein n=1 Tax=Nematostella vectensis TaxID=45351 RepID=A7S9C5_NEMVE|nr:predicted protein [Nematostella vectensis]|eukprot:XP_001631711.1 predicted protein [Nematostella vectensis]
MTSLRSTRKSYSFLRCSNWSTPKRRMKFVTQFDLIPELLYEVKAHQKLDSANTTIWVFGLASKGGDYFDINQPVAEKLSNTYEKGLSNYLRLGILLVAEHRPCLLLHLQQTTSARSVAVFPSSYQIDQFSQTHRLVIINNNNKVGDVRFIR